MPGDPASGDEVFETFDDIFEKTEEASGGGPDAGDLPQATLEALSPRLREAAARAGWTALMPVQARALPYMLAGRDLMVQSRTGSGKTGAFVLPILEQIDERRPECQALVLVPTRELALQVATEATTLAGDSGIRVVPVYGGVGYGPQLEAFRAGAHLVVGTPGRILDHLMRGTLDVSRVRVLVFDEADRLMSMGFYPDMVEVKSYLPARRSSYMFSATYPAGVMKLARQFLRDPEFLSLSRDGVHVTEMQHVVYEVDAMDKDRALVRVIEIENPASAIIFCNTKARVEYVTTVLQRFGYDADQLTADLSQSARERVLGRIRQKNLRFLVATDLAARGIDISDLSHVIIYEFPEDPESYIHRAGRTARAGATGTAISLVTMQERADLQRLLRQYGIPITERPSPTDEDVQAVVSQRVTALLEQRLRQRDRLRTERMRRFLPLARTFGESDDELALIAMLLDDFYQESLHAPQVPPDEPERTPHVSAARPRGGESASKPGRGSRSGGSRRRRNRR